MSGVLMAASSGGIDVSSTPITVTLTATGAGTYTVPSNWNSGTLGPNPFANKIGCYAGGGGATAYGAGGGAYSEVTNLALTAGASVPYSVAPGAAATVTGSDTWFNASTLAASSVGAKGGVACTGTSCAGGNAASGIGTTKFSGGAGGGFGGGGGGAAGPSGGGGNAVTSTGGAGNGGLAGAGGNEGADGGLYGGGGGGAISGHLGMGDQGAIEITYYPLLG